MSHKVEIDEEVDNTKFYELLEVSKDATPDQIKKQYR
jgi:curved DNA-binding protein CbpA